MKIETPKLVVHTSATGAMALSESDKKLLETLEAKVETSVFECCIALVRIRDHNGGIFWKTFTSFAEYVQARFSYQKQHAFRLIAAGTFLTKLQEAKIIDLPTTESQVRPIINKIPEEKQVECWKNITKEIPKENRTLVLISEKAATFRKSLPKTLLDSMKKDRKPKISKTVSGEGMVAPLINRTKHMVKAADIHKLLNRIAVLINEE